ncbi:MAG: replication protein, partial [Fastidiosipila sp.]|nr:replication protein [Fastidiosipila sp.]
MSAVKWIKITTNMFDDEKIDFIESLPEADAILIIWIKLLTLAGKCNAGGFIYLADNIPYTEEMLTHKFKRPLNTVR